VRSTLVGGWVVLILAGAGAVAPVQAQFSFDARRIGMGGLSLSRDGNLRRYNPAYRAVPRGKMSGAPKFTIPIPLGLIAALKDSAAFDFDSSYWNPIELANVILNPPLYLEIKKAPTPTNDVTFTIGRNALIIDLGKAQQLVPTDVIGIGGSSRFLDLGIGIKGVHVGVMAFLQDEAGFTLGDTLRDFLRNADSARANTRYFVNLDGTGQVGFMPTVSIAERLSHGAGDDDGVYVGGALHYYYGAAFAQGTGTAGFRTGSPIFADTVSPDLDMLVTTSNRVGHAFGRGVGGDMGIAVVSGPVEFGVGVNDVGATLTWKDTKVRQFVFDTTTNQVRDTVIADHVQSKTKLPVSYIANVSYHMGTGLTLGGDIVDNGRGTTVHVGAELRLGVLALRGGVSRDTRKKMQFGAGTGLRLGPFGLDVGLWTHSNSLSNARGVTMATSLSIY
jgi:hypothetical protein